MEQFHPDNHGLVEANGVPPHSAGSRAEGNTTTAVTVPLNCSLGPADMPPLLLHFVRSHVLRSLSRYKIESSSEVVNVLVQ